MHKSEKLPLAPHMPQRFQAIIAFVVPAILRSRNRPPAPRPAAKGPQNTNVPFPHASNFRHPRCTCKELGINAVDTRLSLYGGTRAPTPLSEGS